MMERDDTPATPAARLVRRRQYEIPEKTSWPLTQLHICAMSEKMDSIWTLRLVSEENAVGNVQACDHTS